MQTADVGLKRGDVSKIARICRVSVAHVWLVALGRRQGSEWIERELEKRGWQKPALVEKAP